MKQIRLKYMKINKNTIMGYGTRRLKTINQIGNKGNIITSFGFLNLVLTSPNLLNKGGTRDGRKIRDFLVLLFSHVQLPANMNMIKIFILSPTYQRAFKQDKS